MLFGQYVRETREALRDGDKRYSVRQVAQRIGIEPAYLSKIERGDVAPPSENTIRRLAADISVDPDILLAMAGKVATDLQEIICARPHLIAELLRNLNRVSDEAVQHILREIKD